MANLLAESAMLQNRFVYYKRLRNDGETYNNPTLTQMYNNIIARGSSVVGVDNASARAERIVNTLRRQATAEAQKEARLLNEKFKCDVKVDQMLTKDVGKQITLLMNDALQLQGIFQRNVARILGDKSHSAAAKTSITSVLDSYFITELRASWDTIGKHINKSLAEDPSQSIADAIDLEFRSAYMEKILDRALTKALNSATWQDGEDNPFKELSEFLDQHSDRRDRLIAAMWENLGINKLRDDLKKQVANMEEFKAYKRGSKKKDAKLVTSIKSGTRQGIMAEVFGTIVSEAARELHGQNFDAEFDRSAQTGGYGVKPDIVITFDVNIDQIIQRYEKYAGADRETNRKRAQDINAHLKRLKNGFVVYENVKDYTLIKKTNDFNGFSAGSEITLKRYLEVMKGTKSREFVGAVVNTIEGAVFEGQKYRNALTEYLAQDIGALLFDDIKTVGASQEGAQSIHIMNLNGVYIPMSYLMLLLAEAFEMESKNNYKDIFSPRISRAHGILYPEHGADGVDGKWTHEDWMTQREDAFNSITISARFMKNFEDVVRELMK